MDLIDDHYIVNCDCGLIGILVIELILWLLIMVYGKDFNWCLIIECLMTDSLVMR